MNVSLSFSNTTAFLVFDREGSPANFIDAATLAELAERLDELVSEPEITGLLIRSAKPDSFLDGAELAELSSMRGARLDHLAATGQAVFNRIADLPFPTVAAIHGRCLGGGYELALACDWRIASDSPTTEIGLTQTRHGLLPAWGGATSLPDLLGLQDALPVILSGKAQGASEAKRKGLVDEVVPKEHLNSHALTFLAHGKRHRTHNPIVHNQAVAALIRVQALKELQKKTHGHLPAPEAALEVAVSSVGRSRAESQQAEREAIVRLAGLPQTAQLMRLCLLEMRAQERRITKADPRVIRRAAVFDGGTMGSGIAYCLSARNIETILQDTAPEPLAGATEAITGLYADAVRRDILSQHQAARGLDRMHPACGKIPLQNRDLIIEASGAVLSERKKIIADLASRSRPDAVFAVTTSAMPIRELCASLPNPGRIIGLHFPNPVHRTRIVEVVRTDATSEETLATTVAFVRGIGKLPVVVRDSPGFLVNRILMPYLVKAVSLFEQGGDPEEIDRAMLSFGMPMGPLRLLDEIGLEAVMDMARILADAFPDRMEIPRVVEKLLEAGHTGRVGGSGFYVHDQTPAVNAEAISFQTGAEQTPEDTQSILVSVMIAEAKRCLAEGVAGNADDIDLAMVLGAGYPPFRGGPLGGGYP